MYADPMQYAKYAPIMKTQCPALADNLDTPLSLLPPVAAAWWQGYRFGDERGNLARWATERAPAVLDTGAVVGVRFRDRHLRSASAPQPALAQRCNAAMGALRIGIDRITSGT